MTDIGSKIPTILLRTLASTYQLYFSSQVAHWNVEGPSFVQLHELFQESYEDAAGAVDDIAERIRQLGMMIPATLPDLLAHASVVPDPSKLLVERVADMHEALERQWNSIAAIADAAEDAGTVDMAGKRAVAHSKLCWKLRSMTKPANY